MTNALIYSPGSLVMLRNRPWVVLPSEDKDVLLLKPLGGTEEEITGIFKPLMTEQLQSYHFIKPQTSDLGDFASAKLLYDAARLSFRNAAGPFRCLGKLSFRPRSYQMVPLIMALKQDLTRLLIADDVGVGKTIEALLIAQELYERKEIQRFAIVCLPHLCDQWQDELKNKFGVEAVIIRSGTVSALERQIRTHENIFRVFPFQIISIDYIKMKGKRQVFLDHCPELIIVDEAHTCAKPQGAHNAQQQRYHLLNDLSKKPAQHLILLTATPHSGKQEEFQSLLGLLKPEFEQMDLMTANDQQRKEIAKYFIQRRRGDVAKWLNEDTLFPNRNSTDKSYTIGTAYFELFNDVLAYAREIVQQHNNNQRKQRYSYWDALALLRGIMSSPAAGLAMLQKKANKKRLVDQEDELDGQHEAPEELEEETILDPDYASDDSLPLSVLGQAEALQDSEVVKLLNFAQRMKVLEGVDQDHKAKAALNQIKILLTKGHSPIVFCRYIQTANYLGQIFKEALKDKPFKNLCIEVITSELDDELRRERIAKMNNQPQRLLIATDCLSEGINLQEGFNALLHYDLPWNPNRLEQREGRIDRFGQSSSIVEVCLLYGSNNPIDGVVLDVLLRKAREIKRSTGIAVPFPEDSATVMKAVTQAILLKPANTQLLQQSQLVLFAHEDIEKEKNRVAKAFEEAEQREKRSRSIFAQNAIKAEDIEQDLREVDEAIGNVQAVEQFVVAALQFLGVQVKQWNNGYKIFTTNIPPQLRELLTNEQEVAISFQSPTPAGFQYLGRNHPFTAHLSQYLLKEALQDKTLKTSTTAARAAVLRTSQVKSKTVLFQMRVRNVIAEEKNQHREMVAEEMWLWGYRNDLAERDFLSKDEAMQLLLQAQAIQNLEPEEQHYWLEEELAWINDEKNFRQYTDPLGIERAEQLVKSHTRYKIHIGGMKYKVVEPVLPMDVLGVYVLLPPIPQH